MTTQSASRMIDSGEEFRVKPFPLSQLGDSWCTVIVNGEKFPRFRKNSTNNHKAYDATWEIENERLYLTSFHAYVDEWLDLSIEDVFGTEKLFAFWFTGELKSNIGKRIYGMFEPTYEKNNVWRFEHGVLKERYVRTNDTAEDIRKTEQDKNWTDTL